MKKGEAEGYVMTPAASKMKRRMKQMTQGAALLVQLPAEQVRENSEVMDLLLDISNHLPRPS